jgi:hypothetical protein
MTKVSCDIDLLLWVICDRNRKSARIKRADLRLSVVISLMIPFYEKWNFTTKNATMQLMFRKSQSNQAMYYDN